VSTRTRRNILQSKHQSRVQDIVTRGPVGCSQSHMTIWKNSENVPGWVIVFESDAHAVSNIRSILADIVKTPFPTTEPQEAGILKFGSIFMPICKWKPITKHLIQITSGNSYGTEGYAMRGKDIQTYLKALTPIEGHIDAELSAVSTSGEAPPIVQTAKNIVYQPIMQGRPSMHPVFNVKFLLPENPTASNAIIITPWVLSIAVIVGIIVLAVLYARAQKKLKKAL
jgi:GR25 family glycosyltransferase involved in LPS biosynthesis